MLAMLRAQAQRYPLTVSALVSLILAASSLLGAAFFIDARYAHEEELLSLKLQQDQARAAQDREVRAKLVQLQITLIENQIMELQYKRAEYPKSFSPMDQVRLDQYLRSETQVKSGLSQHLQFQTPVKE